MDFNDQNNLEKTPNRPQLRKTGSLIYRSTNYQSYHAYRRSVGWSNAILVLGLIFCILSIPLSNFGIGSSMIDIALLLLIIYTIAYFWVARKGNLLKKDSRTAMRRNALSGYLSGSWSLYDGIYDINGAYSEEVAFTYERTIFGNLLKLIRGDKPTLPPSSADLDSLQRMVFDLQVASQIDGQPHWIVYATVDDKMAEYLAEHGFILDEIAHKYRTKPGRLDYAAAVGNFSSCLWKYPDSFKPYVLSVSKEAMIENEKRQQDRAAEYKSGSDHLEN